MITKKFLVNSSAIVIVIFLMLCSIFTLSYKNVEAGEINKRAKAEACDITFQKVHVICVPHGGYCIGTSCF